MDWLIEILRSSPVIPIFLTLGLEFWIGGLRYKSLSLGPVTATLIVGVIIGPIGISISETVKSLAFMLFLFAIGYNVGPQFFRSLKGDGLKQICFALIECALGRSRKSGGSGLGLPLVHKIITSMGGDTSVENIETGGLKFTFNLRAAD